MNGLLVFVLWMHTLDFRSCRKPFAQAMHSLNEGPKHSVQDIWHCSHTGTSHTAGSVVDADVGLVVELFLSLLVVLRAGLVMGLEVLVVVTTSLVTFCTVG